MVISTNPLKNMKVKLSFKEMALLSNRCEYLEDTVETTTVSFSSYPPLLLAVILGFIPNQNVIQMCRRVVRASMHSCVSFSWQALVVTPVLPCKPMICLARVLEGRINSL